MFNVDFVNIIVGIVIHVVVHPQPDDRPAGGDHVVPPSTTDQAPH